MSFNAVVFPGQGAQKRGMAQDFYENFEVARNIFAVANQYLPFDVNALCFEENDQLQQTAYTQPCIVTAEIAMFESLRHALADFEPQYFGGHSLGEYAALVAAQVLPFDVAIQLVGKRGELMQNAGIDGGMAAIIREPLPLAELEAKAKQYEIDIANDNSSSQVVLSGEQQALNALVAELEQAYGADIRCVMLKVSAPFHSRHMKDIEQTFLAFLNQFKDSFNANSADKVVSNYLGRFYQKNTDEIIQALANQLSGSVKWRQNMEALISKTQSILELGPNRPLRGFFKTLGVDVASVINIRSASKTFSTTLINNE